MLELAFLTLRHPVSIGGLSRTTIHTRPGTTRKAIRASRQFKANMTTMMPIRLTAWVTTVTRPMLISRLMASTSLVRRDMMRPTGRPS